MMTTDVPDTPDPFDTVKMFGLWDVRLPAYRVAHYAQHDTWEKGRLLSMHAHLKPGDVLYDCGSEHGDLSAYYASWLGPDGGVVLIEASELFWPVMRATFEANGFVPAGCFAGFASDTDSTEAERTPSWATPTFTRPDLGEGWPSWADPPMEPHHGFRSWIESAGTLASIRFDTLATMTRTPDAFTIDVEGAELVLLRGAERVLRENRPLVWCSIHPTLIAHDYNIHGVPGAGDPDFEVQRIMDYMAGLGYRESFIEENHERHHLFWPEEQSDFDPWLGVEHLRP